MSLENTEGHGSRAGSLVQLGQGSNEPQSSPIVQTPPLGVRDLSRWHKACRPFLLQTIERWNVGEIKQFYSTETKLKNHLSNQLEEKYKEDGDDLSFLDLRRPRNTGFHQRSSQDEDAVSVAPSSTPSETSVGSTSSQKSDSPNNDVQESTRIFIRTLEDVMNEIEPQSRRQWGSKMFKVASLHKSGQRKDEEAQTRLYDAIDDLKKTLVEFQPQMHSIDFLDVGVKLNTLDKDFQEYVTNFFKIIESRQSFKMQGMRALWKRFDGSDSPKKDPPIWKPWKDHKHSSMNDWKPWHEYWHIQSRVCEIGEEVRKTLKDAVQTRDLYLKAACGNFDDIVLSFAGKKCIKVHDTYHLDGRSLLERKFGDIVEDDVGDWVLKDWIRSK